MYQVVTAGDSAYIVPLMACVKSVVEHIPGVQLTILDCGLAENERQLLRRTTTPGTDIHFVDMHACALHLLPSPACGSWSTYARLFIGDLAFASSRVLYLDGDTLILRDVSALFAEDLNACPIAAVREMYTPTFASENGVAHWAELHLEPTTPYFNAGVMLIDIDLWKNFHIKEKALGYLQSMSHALTLFDQEALNVAINGRWRELPPVWNVTRYWFRPERRKYPYEHILAEARILHFLSESKPWLAANSVPPEQSHLFFDYVDRTELAGWRPYR